jgi:hypothetical protein
VWFNLSSCTKQDDFSVSNMQKYQQTDLILSLSIVNFQQDAGLKSATIPSLDSLSITLLYDDGGVWKKISKENFVDQSNLENFQNPLGQKFASSIDLNPIVRANCRFVIRGFNSEGKDVYYGVAEKDLSNSIVNEELTIPLIETKSYFGLNVGELTLSGYKYVFDFTYVKKEIDYLSCEQNLIPFDGSIVPTFYLQSLGDTIKKELVVQGQNATLNDSVVNYNDYIDVAEYFAACAPDGINFNIKIYDGDSLIAENSFNKNWLEFGFNHYVDISNRASATLSFDLVDNKDSTTIFDLASNEKLATIKDGMIGYWNLENDALDSYGSTNGIIHGAVGFNGLYASFDDTSYIELGTNPIYPYANSEWSLNVWVNRQSTGYHSAIGMGRYTNQWIEFWGNGSDERISYGDSQFTTTYAYGSGSANVWEMITLTRKGNVFQVYRNGVLVKTFNKEGTGSFTSAFGENFYIGKGIDMTYVGKIKFLDLVSRELTSEEILYLYNRGNGRSYAEL